MDGKLTAQQQVSDWHGSVRDRIDNLCAIYKCNDIRKGVNIIMTSDSIVMTLYSLLCDVVDADDPQATSQVGDLAAAALHSIVMSVVGLLDVPDQRKPALVNDILAIVDTRYALQNRISATLRDTEDDE